MSIVHHLDQFIDRETKLSVQEAILCRESGITNDSVVRTGNDVNAFLEETSNGMLFEASNGLSLQIAGDTGLDGDASACHVPEQILVLSECHRVPDPIGPAVADAGLNALPAVRLAGVHRAAESTRTNDIVGLLQTSGTEASLGAGQVKADHAVQTVAPGQLCQLGGLLGLVSECAHDHARRDRQCCLGQGDPIADCVQHARVAQAALRVQ
mmetsp:Transcript_17418/g.44348  ORF Transcript_17418/g.44348 Transcript_17418/m.44348 type:complete len:211 (+) Transcript_17418:2103-2735(+)